jgi:hypothetical protein
VTAPGARLLLRRAPVPPRIALYLSGRPHDGYEAGVALRDSLAAQTPALREANHPFADRLVVAGQAHGGPVAVGIGEQGKATA